MLKLAPKLCMIAFAAVQFIIVNAATAAAQDYPNRPIRVIIAVAPGGVSDIFMRALGDRLTAILKQPFIMENKPGGAFNIATRNCAEATPGRIYDLPAAGRAADLQPVPVQEPGLRPDQGHRADHRTCSSSRRCSR